MPRAAAALALGLAVLLAGCGFEPLYGKRQGERGTTADLAAVEVGPIPDRLGQQVRNRLLDLLTPRGGRERPRYRLDVLLKQEKTGVLVESDDTASRINLTLSADFALIDLQSRQRIFDGRTRTIAAYNITRADYANLVAERDATRRAAESVADEITDRIAVFFKRQREARR